MVSYISPIAVGTNDNERRMPTDLPNDCRPPTNMHELPTMPLENVINCTAPPSGPCTSYTAVLTQLLPAVESPSRFQT